MHACRSPEPWRPTRDTGPPGTGRQRPSRPRHSRSRETSIAGRAAPPMWEDVHDLQLNIEPLASPRAPRSAGGPRLSGASTPVAQSRPEGDAHDARTDHVRHDGSSDHPWPVTPIAKGGRPGNPRAGFRPAVRYWRIGGSRNFEFSLSAGPWPLDSLVRRGVAARNP